MSSYCMPESTIPYLVQVRSQWLVSMGILIIHWHQPSIRALHPCLPLVSTVRRPSKADLTSVLIEVNHPAGAYATYVMHAHKRWSRYRNCAQLGSGWGNPLLQAFAHASKETSSS